jgi:hypothetical protein
MDTSSWKPSQNERLTIRIVRAEAVLSPAATFAFDPAHGEPPSCGMQVYLPGGALVKAHAADSANSRSRIAAGERIHALCRRTGIPEIGPGTLLQPRMHPGTPAGRGQNTGVALHWR